MAALSHFGRALGRLGGQNRRTAFRIAIAAAILGQIADETIHHREVGRVDELAAFPALRDKAGTLKILKVEGQRRRQQPDALADGARRQPLRTALDEQSVNRKPVLMGKSAKGINYSRSLHVPTILRVSSYCQP